MSKRLERETKETAQLMAAASAKLTEASTKLARLQKQRRLLQSRAKDMLKRRLSSLNELKAVEEKEKQGEGSGSRGEALVANQSFPNLPIKFDFNSFSY